MRNFHAPGRSPVYATRGMVATSHPLASGVALDTLRAGGNAVDAAVAASAVLAVVEPQMTSVGGDCFAMIARADGSLAGLNGSGRAPAALTPDYLAERGLDAVDPDHGVSVTVPGAVAAWQRLLDEHGTIGLDRALAPAIDVAAKGFAVAPRVAADWADCVPRLARNDGARLHYLTRSGTSPATGDVVRLPALAETLRRIADRGPTGFYDGPVAADIVATVAAAGGCLSLEDLAGVTTDAAHPLTVAYRDASVAELPPNGQGVIALLMLAILSRFDIAGLDPVGAERLHIELEAARLAYACRDRFLSDPATQEVSPEELLDATFVDRLAARIDPRRRMDDLGALDPRSDTDTVYLCVVDEDRTAVSFINSLFRPFGSALVGATSGVALQNRGAGFVTTPGHPNQVAPGKRPMHTLIPGMLMRGGRAIAPFGVMGGQYQACGHGHVIGNLVDFGLDPQAAIDLPRAFFEGGATVIENGVGEVAAAGLAERGHTLTRPAMPLGGGQAILIDWDRGVLVGGSDPRKDGCALGL